MYDPGALGAVKDEYRAGGWKHLVDNKEKNGGAGTTDLWLRFDHNAVSNIASLPQQWLIARERLRRTARQSSG